MASINKNGSVPWCMKPVCENAIGILLRKWKTQCSEENSLVLANFFHCFAPLCFKKK